MDTVGERVALLFLQQLAVDDLRGSRRALAEYQALYPGHEQRVAEEWAALDGPWEPPPDPALDPSQDPPGKDRRVGPYRLLSVLGQGGQGVVYLARDERLPRTVALKLLPGLPSGALPARARREVEAIARLDHPGLCVVLEAGVVDGQAFVAMRHVPGRTLAQQMADERASERSAAAVADAGRPAHAPDRSSTARATTLRRLELVEKVARALHAAHEAGVVHRDVKPANIMVHADTGDPVVLDFGLARSDDSAVPTLTASGDVLGTTHYSAPERLSGRSGSGRGGDSDRRVDVWSLGVVLYELLTGRRPFEGATLHEVADAVLTLEPVNPRRLVRGLPRDVSVVVATALEKAPARRYATALELAEDLCRARRGEAIHARPAGPAYRLRRWVRRNPAPAALLVLLAAGAAAAMLVALRLADAAAAERRAGLQTRAALALGAFEQARLHGNSGDPGRRWRVLDAAAQAVAGLDPQVAQAAAENGLTLPETELRALVAGALMLPDARVIRQVQQSAFGSGRFSRDGRALALSWLSADFSRSGLRVLSVPDGPELGRIADPDVLSTALDVAVEDGAARLAVPRRDLASLGVWDVAAGERVGELRLPPGQVWSDPGALATWRLAWQPGGTRVALAARGHGWALWDADDEALILWAASPEDTPSWVGFSPDGRWLVVPQDGRTVLRLDLRPHEPAPQRLELPGAVHAAAVTSDGRLAAVVKPGPEHGPAADLFVVSDPELGSLRAVELERPAGAESPLVVDPTGRHALMADEDDALLVIGLADLHTSLRASGAHTLRVSEVCAPGGGRLLSHNRANRTLAWEAVLDPGLERPDPLGADGWAAQGSAPFGLGGDGTLLARVDRQRPEVLVLHALGAGAPHSSGPAAGKASSVGPPPSAVRRVLVSDDGGRVARVCDDGIDLYDRATDGGLAPRAHWRAEGGERARDAVFDGSGRLGFVVRAGDDPNVQVLVLPADGAPRQMAVPEDAELHLSRSAERLCVVPTTGIRPPGLLAVGTPYVLSVADGARTELEGVPADAYREVHGLVFDASGDRAAAHVFLASAGDGPGESEHAHAVLVWSTADGSLLARIPHEGEVRHIAPVFSPDGALLALRDPGGRVRLASAQDGAERLSWSSDRSRVRPIAFLQQGRVLALWEPGRELTLLDLSALRAALGAAGLDW